MPLESLPLPAQLGIIGVLLLALVSVLIWQNRQVQTGKLIPKPTHDEAVARERQRAEDFRELWQVSDKRGDVMEGVAGDIVVIGENLDKVLKSLPSPYQEERQ